MISQKKLIEYTFGKQFIFYFARPSREEKKQKNSKISSFLLVSKKFRELKGVRVLAAVCS